MLLASTNDAELRLFGGGLASCGCCCFPVSWFLLAFYPCWWLSWRLPALFISRLTCPRCGFAKDAVGVWSSGQYTDHRERHVYLFRNPIDGGRVGHVNCEQCGSTILL